MLLLSPLFVGAQVAINTALVGTVTDANGGALVGAHVTAVNTDTKVPFGVVTNAEGYYSISGGINPGTYDITVEQSGFQKELSTGAIVTLNEATRTDFALKPGSAATEVTVTANTKAIQTDDSLLGETVSEKMIENLPMNGRNALDLAATASNVSVSSSALTGVPPGEVVSGAGTRGINNSVTLDGISIMNDLIVTTTVTPNPDALNAVQTQNGNYTAQYGDYLGVHVNEATKSGTNQFHGTGFEYLQNDAFNSRGFNHSVLPICAAFPAGSINCLPKTHFRYDLFGGVVSGPIIVPWLFNGKDKAFFMGSYQGLRQKTISNNFSQAYTPAELAGDFSVLLNPVYNGTFSTTLASNKATIMYSPFDGHAYFNLVTGVQKIDDQPQNLNKTIVNNILAYAPKANRLVAGDTTGNATLITQNFQSVQPSSEIEDQSVDRIDFNPSEKIRLFGRFDWQHQEQLTTSPAVVNNGYGPTWARNGAAGYTQIITPNLVNDLRAGFNWIETDALNYQYVNNIQNADTLLGIPGYNYGTPSGNPGLVAISAGIFSISEGSTNWIQDDRTLQAYDQISWTKNKHSLSAGVDLRRLTIGRVAANNGQGIISFSAATTGLRCATCTAPALPTGVGAFNLGSSDASLYDGVANTAISPFFQVKSQDLQWRDGFFVQDTWQFSKRLTLEYGLRYELPLVATSQNGNARILDPTLSFLIPATNCVTPACAAYFDKGFKFTAPNHKDIAPRFGFSFRATDKVVIRGGGGIYFNEVQLNAFTLTDTNYPYSNSVTYQSPSAAASIQYTPASQALLVTLANPAPGAANLVPVAGTPGTYVQAFTDNYYLPSESMYQWNLDNGIQLWRNAGIELQYIGSHTIHLNESWYANQPNPCGCIPYSLGNSTVNSRRPDQNWGVKRVFTDDSTATYEGLTTVFRQRLSRGLSMNVSYTWAHSFDEVNNANNGGSAMWQGHLKLEYGPSSNGDTRHNVVTSFTWALPSLARHNFLIQEAVGGWQLNGIVTLASGGTINVTTGTDWADVATQGAGQRMNWVHAPNQHVGVGCTKAALLAQPYGSSTPACLDVTAYAPPTQYTYGNLHKNDLHGLNGSIGNNLSLFKSFTLYEQVKFQLRGEAFNAFNHANMGNTSGSFSIANPSAGTLANQLRPTIGNGLTPSSSFGQAGSGGGGRTVQISGRINF